MTRILLSTNVRDERNLSEWVLYHWKIGFDGIWIWDDFSTSEWSPETLLKDLPSLPHGKNLELVHGKDHPRVRDKKAYMNKAKQYASCNGYDWMIHIDLDEYFYCEQEEKYKEANQYPEQNHQVPVGILLFSHHNHYVSDT